MQEHEQMHREWLAWRAVCRELEARGVDINGAEDLANAIRLWGEELVALRWYQDEFDVVEKALEEARAKYAVRMKELQEGGKLP